MTVEQGLRTVSERIAEAAARSGREFEQISLVGVSKGAEVQVVAAAVNAGLREVGENRVQEAAVKVPAVANMVTQPPAWHLVGHLQTNKARAALGLFAVMQSVDSTRVAHTLSRLADQPLPIFLEVQFARTPDRFGFEPEAVGEAFDEIAPLPNLRVRGLMTVAPLGLDADATRRVFRALRETRDRLQEERGLDGLDLSMGMTDDYEIAIEEGATVVRIGRAIFAA
jgi:pyridoxal phosphate enzyme (YggS family)